MADEIRTGKPPGEASLLPEHARTAARDASKQVYLQRGRVCAGRSTGDGSDDDQSAGRRAARRRRAEAKKKANSDKAGGAGAEKGPGQKTK